MGLCFANPEPPGSKGNAMNFLHVSVKSAKVGRHPGGLRGLVEYNERVRQEVASQATRYIEREGGYAHKQDLVEKGMAQLPGWAVDTIAFFATAEQYGRQNHNPARVIEVALPRELSASSRLELATAMRETYFSQHPHSWAIHNPLARDGQPQPHLHLVVSMRVDDGMARSPEQWFKRYNPAYPERGGAYRYDTFDARGFQGRQHVKDMREGMARLTNLVLERDGHEHRVYAGTLKSLWIEREAARYLSPVCYQSRDPEARQALHKELTRRDQAGQRKAHEQEYIQAAWHQTKDTHHYHGLTLAMAVDYERERFYATDRTPWREREREATRAITVERERVQAREYSKRHLAQSRSREQVPTRQRGIALERTRGHAVTASIDLASLLPDEATLGGGVRFRRHQERERETDGREVGMGF